MIAYLTFSSQTMSDSREEFPSLARLALSKNIEWAHVEANEERFYQ